MGRKAIKQELHEKERVIKHLENKIKKLERSLDSTVKELKLKRLEWENSSKEIHAKDKELEAVRCSLVDKEQEIEVNRLLNDKDNEIEGDIVKCCVWNSLGGDPNFLYSIHETDTANHLW